MKGLFLFRMICFLVVIIGIGMFSWDLNTTSNELVPYQKDPKHFPSLLSPVMGRGRDTSDYQWFMIVLELPTYIFWVMVYMSCSYFLRITKDDIKIKGIPVRQILGNLISVASLCHTTSALSVVYLITVPSVFYLTAKGCCRLAKGAIVVLTIVNLYVVDKAATTLGNDEIGDFHFYTIAVWLIARCASFSCEIIDGSEGATFGDALSYALYFPTLFYGPLILYPEYVSMVRQTKGAGNNPSLQDQVQSSSRRFIFQVCRVGCWVLIQELLIHHLYFGALTKLDVRKVSQMTPTTSFAIVFWLTQGFLLKTLVQFAIGNSMAKFDGVKVDNLPICPVYAHRYAHMRKYFDYGLYKFSAKYIYFPLMTAMKTRDPFKQYPREIQAPVAAFFVALFMYMWHGFFMVIFVWAMLLFLENCVDNCGKLLKRKLEHFVGQEAFWSYIVEPVVTVPLTLAALLINAVFISFNGDLVWVLAKRIAFGGNFMPIFVYLFCVAQVGITFREVPCLGRYTVGYGKWKQSPSAEKKLS